MCNLQGKEWVIVKPQFYVPIKFERLVDSSAVAHTKK